MSTTWSTPAVLRREGTFDAGSEIAWVRGIGWAMDVYDLGARDVAGCSSVDGVVTQLGKQGAPLPARVGRAEIAAPSEPAVTALADQVGPPDRLRVNAGGTLPTCRHRR